jgi:hypothetical protein
MALSTPNAARDFADAPRPTRRVVLQGALAAAIVGGAAAAARAQNKAKKSLVHYQETPKAGVGGVDHGDRTCDTCLQWAPPDACKVVEGKINPKGWCALYLVPMPK